MGRIWALCMGKNSHRYIFCVAHCPQEHSFIFKIAFPRFLHSWKPLALLWAKMRLSSSTFTTPQPFGFSPSNFVACLATLLRLAEKYPSSLQCLAWCPQCNIMPKVHHQAMGCPYWPPSLHFFLPAGHGVPRLAQRKRTRPLRRPPHPSGQLRCVGAPRSRECCCARSRPRPSARRLVLRAPMPQGAVAWPAATCTSATAAPERKQHVHTFMKVSDFHH